MKAVRVTVADLKKKNVPFENERIEVTVDLEPGETAEQGVEAARLSIARIRGEAPSPEELDEIIEGVEQDNKAVLAQLRRMRRTKRI